MYVKTDWGGFKCEKMWLLEVLLSKLMARERITKVLAFLSVLKRLVFIYWTISQPSILKDGQFTGFEIFERYC